MLSESHALITRINAKFWDFGELSELKSQSALLTETLKIPQVEENCQSGFYKVIWKLLLLSSLVTSAGGAID